MSARFKVRRFHGTWVVADALTIPSYLVERCASRRSAKALARMLNRAAR